MKTYISGNTLKRKLRMLGYDVVSARQAKGVWEIFVEPPMPFNLSDSAEVNAMNCTSAARRLLDNDAVVVVRTRGLTAPRNL